MTSNKGPDPVTPPITFDSYIIPETVREHRSVSAAPFGPMFGREKKPKKPAAPLPPGAMVSTGIIVFLTFMLGVVTTLHLTKPQMAAHVHDELLGMDVQRGVSFQDVVQANSVAAADPASVLQENNAASLARAVSASLEQDVTRQAPADLITPAGALSASDPDALSMAEILQGLSPTRGIGEATHAASQSILNRDKLRILRDGVLSGDYTVRTVTRHGQKRLSLRIPSISVSPDEAADLLRAAAARGEIALPSSLSTAEGDFDADTLIFNLVQTSLANDGTPEGKQAAKEMSRRAFAASNARTKKVKGLRLYEVTAGDSLAYISLQFYGQPSAYLKIYNANRNILKSPDKIQVGQRLIIPG